MLSVMLSQYGHEGESPHMHQENFLHSDLFKYCTTAALALYMYDYLLTLSEEVSPRIKLKVTLTITCASRCNTSGGAEKLGVSPGCSPKETLCVNFAVFYVFLIVSSLHSAIAR